MGEAHLPRKLRFRGSKQSFASFRETGFLFVSLETTKGSENPEWCLDGGSVPLGKVSEPDSLDRLASLGVWLRHTSYEM